MSKVELDRKRRRMKWNSNGPHALACRKGEGPPIAPHGWQWFTGRRAKDIAFVSPSGQRFRSKVALDRFLATIPDPPSQNDFAWRVRKSDFENVPLPGEEKRFSAHKKSSAKEIHKRARPLKSRLKIQQLQKLQQDRRTSVLGDSSVNAIAGADGDAKQDISVEVPVSQGQKRKRPFRQKSKVCKFCGPLEHAAGQHGEGHHVAGQHGKGHHARHCVYGSIVNQKDSVNNNSHPQISDDEKILTSLFEADGRKDSQSVSKHAACLDEAAKVLRNFLVEAGELKENSEVQGDELCKILLYRSFTRESMKAFPKNVLHAVVLLMRNEEAPLALGRRELIRLCTKWYCKYKHFWCLLEEHRIRSVVEKFISDTSVLDQSLTGQSKSEAPKDLCVVDPFVGGQYVDNHADAHLLPELNPKLKVAGITESLKTVGQCEGSCYRNRPCKECRHYLTIKDALTSFVGNELGKDKGLERQVAASIDSPKMGGWLIPHSSMTVAEKQNAELLFQTPDKERVSEETFLANKTKKRRSCGNMYNEADRKYEDLSSHESVGILDQIVTDITITPQHVNSGDLVDLKLSVDIGDCEQGWGNCLDNEYFKEINNNNSVKHGVAVATGPCNCKSCSANMHFCPGCMCYICNLSIQPNETWNYIKCSCYHIFHLECTIKEKIGGVVKERNIDGEFLCPVCSIKCDLFPFWKERLENASDTESKDTLQKHLKSAISVMDGTQRKRLKALHCKVLNAHESVAHSTCSDLRKLLVSILEDNKTRKMSKSIHGFLDKKLQIKEIELVEGQQFVKLSQEAADRDLEIYKKAQDLVATQKELLAQAQENVKKAEAKMQLAYEESKSSAKVARKAINRLELLKMNYKPQPVTKYQVEVQRKFYEREVSKLRRIQRMMGSINCYCEESLPELNLLLESMKQQRKKVEAALRKMEDMASLCVS